MMKAADSRYLRAFTGLDGLQKQHTVEYTLYGGDPARITLCQREDGAQYQQTCLLPPVTLEFARSLLQFLYENAVTPENLCGIVENCC